MRRSRHASGKTETRYKRLTPAIFMAAATLPGPFPSTVVVASLVSRPPARPGSEQDGIASADIVCERPDGIPRHIQYLRADPCACQFLCLLGASYGRSDLMPFGKKTLGGTAADATCCSNDENFHVPGPYMLEMTESEGST
jgi:hypothetical protein